MERLRPLTSTLNGPGASFTEAELPSSGELTKECDRSIIMRIEEDVHATYVRSAVLTAKVRVETSCRKRRNFVLSGKQVRDSDLPTVIEVLSSASVAPHVHALKLDGNLITAEGIHILGATVLCSPDNSLRELSLSDNSRLLSAGVAALAFYMPSVRIATLRLAGCGISSDDGCALAAVVPACACLSHLDQRRNRLDDFAVDALLTACKQSEDTYRVALVRALLRVTLDIEDNPAVSAAMFSKVTVECGVHA
jgi:hypothetical protein